MDDRPDPHPSSTEFPNESSPLDGSGETSASADEDPAAQHSAAVPPPESDDAQASGDPQLPADSGGAMCDSSWRKLDARNITLDRLSGLTVFVFVFVAGAIGIGMVILTQGGFNLISIAALSGFLLILGSLLFVTIVWPKLVHRHASWRLTANGLEIRRGVLWRHHITVPIDRVQHADVSQGPLQRQFGLGTLTLHTAGTQNADVPLEGLAHSEALEIRDTIVLNREADDGV